MDTVDRNRSMSSSAMEMSVASLSPGLAALGSGHFVSDAAPTIAWAAARRAIGTRNGEQDT